MSYWSKSGCEIMAKVLRLFTSLIKLASAMEGFPHKIEAEINFYMHELVLDKVTVRGLAKWTRLYSPATGENRLRRDTHRKIAYAMSLMSS